MGGASFEDIGSERLAEVELQAEELESWLDDKRLTARFCLSPGQELSSLGCPLDFHASSSRDGPAL